MKLTYHGCGDYLLPDLTIPDEPATLGKYGRMRKTYLQAHKPILYNTLLLSGKLTKHLAEVDEQCRERLETLVPQMMRREGVDEAHGSPSKPKRRRTHVTSRSDERFIAMKCWRR